MDHTMEGVDVRCVDKGLPGAVFTYYEHFLCKELADFYFETFMLLPFVQGALKSANLFITARWSVPTVACASIYFLTKNKSIYRKGYSIIRDPTIPHTTRKFAIDFSPIT